MSAPVNRRGNFLVVIFLLLLCILLERFFIAPFFPMIEAAGSIRPMVVFLDIPLPLPAIDWLPVSALFIPVYALFVGPNLSRSGPGGLLRKRIWKALTGWYLLLACIAAGGGLYYLVEDYLPKQVGNGIDSFGVRADLTLPYPSGELIHLHGSVIQLLFALLGLHLMARRTAVPQPVIAETPAATPTPTILQSRAVAEAQAIINTPPPKTPTTTIIKTPRREPILADEPAAPKRPSVAADPIPSAASRRSSVSVTPPPARAALAQERAAVAQDRPAFAQDHPAPRAPAFPGEPPTCRLTTPPPIAIVMPRAAPGIGKVHPCFVIGSLKPTKRES
jgi:hypothetical protein